MKTEKEFSNSTRKTIARGSQKLYNVLLRLFALRPGAEVCVTQMLKEEHVPYVGEVSHEIIERGWIKRGHGAPSTWVLDVRSKAPSMKLARSIMEDAISKKTKANKDRADRLKVVDPEAVGAPTVPEANVKAMIQELKSKRTCWQRNPILLRQKIN